MNTYQIVPQEQIDLLLEGVDKAARYTGGLWTGKFIKTLTYQRLDKSASHRIAPIMSRLCAIEGMLAHKATADVRHERYKGEQ